MNVYEGWSFSNIETIARAYESSDPNGDISGRIAQQRYNKILERVWRPKLESGFLSFSKENPYESCGEMVADLYERMRLKVWNGANDHPGMPGELNLFFRADHDWFGHVGGGHYLSYAHQLPTVHLPEFNVGGECVALIRQIEHHTQSHKLSIPDKEAISQVIVWEILGQLACEVVNGEFPQQKTLNLSKLRELKILIRDENGNDAFEMKHGLRTY